MKNKTRLFSILGLIGNIILLIIKGIVGFLFKSQAMIADATNSAGDIFASFMSFIGNKIACVPPDEDHNLGHGKAEYLFSLFIGLTMIIASLTVIISSVKNIIARKYFIYSNWLVYICVVTIVVKFVLYIFTKREYKSQKNILLKSLYIDHRNDVLITIGTLISNLFSFINIFWLDSILGILISFIIIYTGIKIIVESYEVLMDQSIDLNNKNKIIKIIDDYSDDINMGNMCSIPIGYKYIIVLTIYVDGNMTTIESHKITKELQKRIIREVKIVDRVVIHVNPK